MMVKGAHFHERRLLKPLRQFENKLGAVVPGILAAAQNVFPIKGIQIDHVKTAMVVKIGRALGYFRKECRFWIRHEQPETLLQMVHFDTRLMCRNRGAKSATLTAGESIWCGFGNSRVGNQFFVEAQRDTVAHEKSSDGGHRFG